MGGLETRATVGQSLILGLSFSVDYSNKDVGTKYEMALIDNEFAGTINTRYFDNQEDQMDWYDTKIETTKAGWNDLLNPNINALVLSSQRYTNDSGEDVNELLMYNYAIIRETKGNNKKYYYYEITNANVTNANIITLDLKMDTLQTWYFDADIEFSDCMVERACIDRFIDNEDGTVSFDCSETSPLFESEETEALPKRVVNR